MLNNSRAKLAIVIGYWKQIKLTACGFLLLSLAGCATPGAMDGSPGAGADDSGRIPADRPAAVTMHLRQAEQATAIGDHETALEQLLLAAQAGDEVELAQQAAAMAWRFQQWETLVEATERWQSLAPAEADARRLRVLGMINSGRAREAAVILTTWIEAVPLESRPAAWREVTQLLAGASEPELALGVFEQLLAVLGEDAQTAEIARARSQLAWQIGDAEQALEWALVAVELEPERVHLVWAAQLSTALDDYPQALGLYRQARSFAPDDVPLGLSEAEVLRQLDQLDQALVVLEALAEDLDVLYSLSSYQYLAGQPEQARSTWQRMAEWEPVDDANEHAFMVAWLAEVIGLKGEAAEWYGRVRGGSNVDRALLRRAILLSDAGRIDEARQLLILARDTERADLREQAWLVEADILREAGQADAAVDLIGQALLESPNSISLLYARAINAVENDDLALAEQDLRRIIQIDGANAMALNALGYTLTDRTSRHSEAYRLIRRALDLQPDEPAILDSMGWVYFRLGRPEMALGYLERALAGEDNPEIAAHLAEVLWTLDQTERARSVLHEAWERHPEDRFLSDTMERLQLWP